MHRRTRRHNNRTDRFLSAVTYDTYRTGVYEENVNNDVAAVLDSPEYAELSLIDITVEYTDPVPFRQPERVVVRIAHPVGTDPPPIGDEIQSRESVRADSAIQLPTGPLIKSQRAEVIVYYTEKDDSSELGSERRIHPGVYN